MRSSSERVQHAIQRSGLNNRVISKRMNVSDATVSNWRHGYRTPTPEHLIRLSRVLGVDVDTLTVEEPVSCFER